MKHLLYSLLICLGITGCADDLSGDVYTRDEARQSMQVQYGVVDGVRPVVIEGEKGFLGQGGGAVIGGIAGNSIGGGTGRALGTAVGAIAGSVAGGAVQERATRAQGAEIIVRLDNGTDMAVVQEVEHINQFVVGQRVRITGNGRGTRVAPLGYPASPRY